LDAAPQDTHDSSDSPEHKGRAALYSAVEEGNVEVLRTLLEKGGLDVNWGHNKKTALDIASSKANLELARMLIGNGADVSCRTSSGWSPLHGVSRNGHLDVARSLLNHGASVNLNAKMQYQWKPLHSSQQGHFKVKQLLPERGADPHAQNDKHQTAAQLSIQGLARLVRGILFGKARAAGGIANSKGS
jgi:ankyrin repeat protein